jgi:hypothetical protein
MAHRGLSSAHRPTSEAKREAQALARRMARAEVITRVVCVLLGLAFGVSAVALFVLVLRLGPRAIFAAIVGAALLAIPACFLLRRGLTGRDVDRYDLDELTSRNLKVWWGRH